MVAFLHEMEESVNQSVGSTDESIVGRTTKSAPFSGSFCRSFWGHSNSQNSKNAVLATLMFCLVSKRCI